ncbi:hypothetical protein MKW92_016961 [Papaver armeniacum]|nr:hypothetical protein MKW92_016961 [Papaver armeniacum]
MVVTKKATTSSNPNNSSFMFCSMMKCLSFSSSSTSLAEKSDEDFHVDDVLSKTKLRGGDHVKPTKHGGWKSMRYILGNETFERLATYGLLANFMVYLLKQFHLEQVFATNIINIWSGTTNFAPLFASLDLFFLLLGFLTIGAGVIRPCSLPFGVHQFDQTTEDGRKGINSFFNWYYITFTIIIIIVLTLVVYIQDIISWSIVLGIPTLFMVFSILMFFGGTRVYVYVPPSGMFVSSYKKRRLQLPSDDIQVLNEILHNPESGGTPNTKLHRTNQYRILNKGAMKNVGEVHEDGLVSIRWRLCIKCLIRTIPVWAAGIILSLALKMDRYLGSENPGWSTWGYLDAYNRYRVAFYDQIFVPALRKII